jgi:hypothetical protein
MTRVVEGSKTGAHAEGGLSWDRCPRSRRDGMQPALPKYRLGLVAAAEDTVPDKPLVGTDAWSRARAAPCR